MGYSNSKKGIEKIKPLLDTVLASEGKRITFPSNNPVKTSYTIREVLKHLERIEPKYKKVLELFVLRVRPNQIIFDPRVKVDYEDPIVELAKARTGLEIKNISNVLAVVGACIKHKAPVMIFPDALLEQEESVQLAQWTSKNNYEIACLKPLTLQKNDTGKETDTVIER